LKKNFLTIATNAQANLFIKKSNFISYVKKTSTEADTQAFIDELKAVHPKAKHYCFATIIGPTDQIQRASDNGEPSGTAGVPILNVLKKNQLHNVTAVVIRYFGGIKLGTGGLIRAYSNATSAAIEQAGIVCRIKATVVTVEIAYHQFDLLKNYFDQRKIELFNLTYLEKITLSFSVPSVKLQQTITEIKNLLNGQLLVKATTLKYIEVPYLPAKQKIDDNYFS
jgi:uncharacterized YigZ family protein